MSSQQEENSLTKVLGEQKKTFYQFTHQLVNNQFNLKMYYVLIAIEHLQIVGFQCHSVYDYKGWAVDWFREFTNSINPQFYLRTTPLMDYIIPISFMVVLAHLFSVAFSYYSHRHKANKKDLMQVKKKNFMLVTHYFTVFMATVLTIPIFLPSLLVFYCHSESPYHRGRDCYSTYHLFLIIISLINILWLCTINIYYFLFYFTKNPFNYKNFLALSSSLWNMLKFAVKVVPAGYLIFDETLQFNILFVVGMSAGLLGYTAISRVLYPYTRYNKYIQRVMISIEVTSISISITFIIQAFFSDSFGIDITFITSFLISVPLAKLGYELIMDKKQKMLLKINTFERDNTQTLQDLLMYLVVQLQDDSVQAKQKRLFKVVKYHNDKCQNVQCACHTYLRGFGQDQNYFENKTDIYKVFLEVIHRIVQANRKAYSLLLLKSYIQYFKLKNSIKAAFIISKIMHQKISFFEEYLTCGFLYQISKSFQDTTNIQKYRLFSEHLIQFQKQAIRLAHEYEQFWHQLGQQNSSLVKIMNLLKEAKKTRKVIEQQFSALYGIYPSNIRISQIYKQLHRQVLINYQQFMKFNSMYKDNAQEKQQSKLIRPNYQIKFAPNQDLLVINASFNVASDIFQGGCEIVSVTSNVYKILGYSSQELVGKNINRFLPKIYVQFHDQFIGNYLSKNDSQIRAQELIIFPINSNGHLVECTMVNKILPSLEYGVNIVSFLLNTKQSKQNLIIYDKRTGLVDSMSQKAELLLLGKRQKTQSISIPDLITDILPVWDHVNQMTNQQRRKSAKQINLTYSNLYLYRSDGPSDNKFVKIVTFQLAFNSKIFTISQCLQENQNFWSGFHTLLQNQKQQPNNTQNKQENLRREVNEERTALKQTGNTIFPLRKNRNANTIQQVPLYKPLPNNYPKVYIILQICLILSLIAQITYNYVSTLDHYFILQNDIVLKQNIADGLVLLLISSQQASQYVYTGDIPVVIGHTNKQVAVGRLRELMRVGQYIYQEIIKKEKKGQISIRDLILEVKYYSSSTTFTVKEQTVTDASNQLVLYLLQVYSNPDPIQNLPNNILFVSRNFINISNQFQDLNEIFTSNIIRNSEKRTAQIISLTGVILAVLFISIIWESAYRLIIASKINQVIGIYRSIPIQMLQKYPVKCQRFIRHVSPVYTSKQALSNTVPPLRNADHLLSNKVVNNQMQTDADPLIQNDVDPLIQEQEQVQFITFSNSFSLFQIMFRSLGFLVIFIVFYVVTLNFQNNLIEQNLKQVNQWNIMVNYRSQLIKSVYFLNQHKNLHSQWNTTQLVNLQTHFKQSIEKIQGYIESSTKLDDCLARTYQLIEQLVHIMNNPSVIAEQLISIQQKIIKLSNQVQITHIDTLIQRNIVRIIASFLDMLQLILIGQIAIFALYAIIYIPMSYRAYSQKNQITQLMFDTLGFKLQSIARSNYENK